MTKNKDVKLIDTIHEVTFRVSRNKRDEQGKKIYSLSADGKKIPVYVFQTKVSCKIKLDVSQATLEQIALKPAIIAVQKARELSLSDVTKLNGQTFNASDLFTGRVKKSDAEKTTATLAKLSLEDLKRMQEYTEQLIAEATNKQP